MIDAKTLIEAPQQADAAKIRHDAADIGATRPADTLANLLIDDALSLDRQFARFFKL